MTAFVTGAVLLALSASFHAIALGCWGYAFMDIQKDEFTGGPSFKNPSAAWGGVCFCLAGVIVAFLAGAQ